MVEFGGWAMPVQYTSIVEEHQATRSAAGLFDISHMGRLRVDGPGAGAWLDRLVTRRVGDQPVGAIRYALVTNERGGILDDVLVYHLADAAGQSYYLVVVNAGNRTKIAAWLADHAADSAEAQLWDVGEHWAMIALQGPRAAEVLQPLVEVPLDTLAYYQGCETRIAGHGGIVSRTGYTGEDGFELIVGAAAVTTLWERLLADGASRGVVPAGLAARDTLRLEAGMPLYGHELSEAIDPLEAGLGFAVDFDKPEWIGRAALAQRRNDTKRPRRIGLELSGKRVPREGYTVLDDGRQVGTITSGTFSPTFQRPLAMAYVEPRSAQVGTELAVDIRGRLEPARVVKLPFYRRSRAKES